MTEQPKSIADVLDAAADLIEPEGRWTQGAYGRDADGGEVNPHERWRAMPKATCFCMYGAVAQISAPLGFKSMPPSGSWGLPSTEWNDAPERTQSEVVAKLREAAALARAEGR